MDITDIKAENVKRILDHLRFSPGLTKRELASLTGLSFSTVSNLCNELKECQVLYEEKSSGCAVGRTPNRLMFRCEGYGSICADLQQAHVLDLAVLDFSNRRLVQERVDLSGLDSAEQAADLIGARCKALKDDPRLRDVRLIGLGVSVPSLRDRTDRGEDRDGSPLSRSASLPDLLGRRLPLPCYVDSEANLCALSMCQAQGGTVDLVYLHSSAGLGVGVVCGGRLLRGSGGYAGGAAHIPLGDPALRCPSCGNFGCIENDLARRGMDALNAPGLRPEARQELLRDRGRKLGTLLSVLANLFDPAILYLGGSALDSFDELFPYASAALRERSAMVLDRGLAIRHDRDSLQTVERGINQAVYERWNPLQTE